MLTTSPPIRASVSDVAGKNESRSCLHAESVAAAQCCRSAGGGSRRRTVAVPRRLSLGESSRRRTARDRWGPTFPGRERQDAWRSPECARAPTTARSNRERLVARVVLHSSRSEEQAGTSRPSKDDCEDQEAPEPFVSRERRTASASGRARNTESTRSVPGRCAARLRAWRRASVMPSPMTNSL